MRTLFVGTRALVFASGFVWLWGWLALWVRRFDAGLGLPLPAWTPPIGAAAMACGAILAASCVVVFVVRGRGTPAPFDPPRAFVASGPYTIVRNPMYVGGWLLLAGLGLMMGSSAILLLSVAFLVIVQLVVVLYEEPALRSKFGAPYEQYRRTVPRWVPVLRRT